MGRGKIEIKKIENQTNRQVTYSKRRNGLFKKAHELTVLCDAQVSIILISNTKRQHDYCSPSTTHKQVYDRYQQVRGEDLWSTHYEKMQNELKSLMEKNEICNRKIRQRTGKDLGGLAYNELHGLEQMMEAAVNVIRERKNQLIKNLSIKHKKKCDKLEEEQGLLQQVEMHERCRYYGNMGNGGANHKTGFKLASQASHIFAFGGETLSTKSP